VCVSQAIRQAKIADMATGIDGVPHEIVYLAEEHETWRRIMTQLSPLWDRSVAPELHEARANLALPTSAIPQLSLVTERLSSLTGFRYRSVAGTVPGHDFFGALSQRVFLSTQFIREAYDLDYTPQPDVVHEVGGHAASLATPQLAELHQLAGRASVAVPTMLPQIASVFWYTVEFGVIRAGTGWKAYGAGLLSSPGELAWFTEHAAVRRLSIADMIGTTYDIDSYQPVLFGADSLDHVLDIVGAFYLNLIDNNPAANT